jgi:hypothetical protein
MKKPHLTSLLNSVILDHKMAKLVVKKKGKSKSVLIGLLAVVVLAIVLVTRTVQKNTNVLTINEVAILSYGPTTLEGILLKETPAGVPGSYLLAIPDGSVIELNVESSIDALLGQLVLVTGTLVPGSNEGDRNTLVEDTIGQSR